MRVQHHGRHGGNSMVFTLYSEDCDGLSLGCILHAPGGGFVSIMSVSQVSWAEWRALTAYYSAKRSKESVAEYTNIFEQTVSLGVLFS